LIARIGRQMASAYAPRLVEAIDQLLVWIERSRQRGQLAQIDGAAMHDLGISRADLEAECRKHFWQR
jgi:uncharacterized protein YjiS (DUF1127 family)